MTRRTTFILAAALLIPVATPAAAQQRPDAWDTYNAESRNEWAAVGLELIFPTLGHAYAGDWKRGILPGVVGIGGYATAIGIYATCDDGDTEVEGSVRTRSHAPRMAALVGLGGRSGA